MQKLFSLLRTLLAILYSIILLTPALLISLLTLQYFATPLWHHTARAWGKGGLWIMGVTLIEENDSTFKEAGSRVVMFNHESFLDIFLFCAISPPSFSTVTKKLFMYIPIINLAFWASGQVFIDRRNNKKAVALLKKLVERFKREKRTLVIAPEGTRTTTGKLQPFKKGGFHMTIASKFPLHIIVIHGAYKRMPPGQLGTIPGSITVRYLPSIQTNHWKIETMQEHMNEVQEHMQIALTEMNSLYPHNCSASLL